MMSDPSGQHVHRGSPPAGTPRTPGSKTPRKVQWLDEHSPEIHRSDSTHGLDERGLDPEAFRRLTEALERHRTSTPLDRIHYYPPQRPDSVADAVTPPADEMPDSCLEQSPHQVPGAYIDADERAGLPGQRNPEDDSRKKASKLVNSHSFMKLFAFGNRSNDSLSSKRHRSVPRRSGRIDVEKDGYQDQPLRRKNSSILSALLSLYNDTPTAYSPLRPQSLLPSPIGEEEESPFDRHPHDRPRSRLSRLVTPFSSAPPSPPEPGKLQEGRRSGKLQGFRSLTNTHFFKHHKPKQVRSGAGVFAPLIASTGNLMGIAAPASSRLQPDATQPGYRLSRYSLDSKLSTLAKPAARPSPLRRSRSMNMSSQSTPPSGAVTPTASLSSAYFDHYGYKNKWTGSLHDLPTLPHFPKFVSRSAGSTPALTPTTSVDPTEPLCPSHGADEHRKREQRKRKRKKAQVFITKHVARIIQRQEFILKMARALMMFGGPSHRLQSQIKSTANVLDIELSCIYLPDVLLISFDDSSTGTSQVRFIRQGSVLDLGKLDDAYLLYSKVIHDELSVTDASAELDILMRRPPIYSWWQMIFIGGMCSAAICTVSFTGSFVDALISFPLGALLVGIQLLSVRNELYSNVFEVTVAMLFSFIAAALAASHRFCYSAVASSSVVLILPGFIVLCGSLEITSRNMVAGSVRLGYAIMYALFLGFGLAMGAKAFEQITRSHVVGAEDVNCVISHLPHGPWYQRTPSKYWAFLTVPLFSLFLSLRNLAPYNRKELPLLVAISCIGWVTNYFTGTKFVGQSDIVAAVGAFAVGVVANLYARIFSGNAFVIMITGILFQVPSGLGSGGLLTYVSQQASGSSTSYVSGFQTALKLLSVGIGLTVGLSVALVLMHPIQSKRRAGGIFSL